MKVPAELLSRLVVRAALIAALAGPDAVHAVQPIQQTSGQVQSVSVPKLTGYPVETGRRMLGRAGLVAGRATPVTSGATPGTIVWQSIPRGRMVPTGTTIDLTYARGGTSDGPAVVDSGRVSKPSGNSKTAVAVGAAAVAIGAILLGRGHDSADATVPDLRDTTIGRAREILERVGLKLGRIDSTKTATGTGLILTHRPTAGSVVKRGTAVQVAVEVAPPARVPNVIGRTEAEALRMIEGAKLRAGVVDSVAADSSLGRVVAQSPPPDSPVWQNTRVGFSIAVQGRWVIVPSLTDSTPEAARRLLAATGLALGKVESIPRAGGTGLISHQSPLPGTRANRGDLVGVRVLFPDTAIVAPTIAQESVPTRPRRATLIVPNVRDSTPEAARRMLVAAGFPGIQVDSVQQAGGSGVVTFQLPRAGTVLVAPVGVVLQIAVAPAPPSIPPPPPARTPLWVLVAGAAGSFGAIALTVKEVRDRRNRRRRQPEVSFHPHSQLKWRSAGGGDDPVDGSDLRLVPGTAGAAVAFQGEP